MESKHIGILTSGGDAPGLNAVIRAIVVKAIKHNHWQVTGVLDGWKGLLRGGKTRPIALPEVSGILGLGGTILKTSRTNPIKKEGGVRAKAVYSTKEEAELNLTKGYSIEFRPGERTRCRSYCQVSKFCNQYQTYLKENQSVDQPE